jgi:uncharacterized protein
VFLSGTLLNVVTVLIGTTVGLVLGARMSKRIQETLTDVLGLFTLVIGLGLSLRYLLDPALPAGNDLAVLMGLLAGAAVGELLRLSDRLDDLGGWFQSRLARGDNPSPISEGFVTASLVFCVGPLTFLGSIQNGLSGDMQLLAIKSLLDGVASIAFAAALGAGVYLSALTILVVQGGIAGAAWLVGAGLDPELINAASAAGGLMLMGIGLRLLELRRIRLANLLPALLLAPLFVYLAGFIRDALSS